MPKPEVQVPEDVQINAALFKRISLATSEVKTISPTELGGIINEAFGASLPDDASIDKVFPRRLFVGNGESFDNIEPPLREKWQKTLAGFSKGERALAIMAVNQINYYRRITIGEGVSRHEILWRIIGPIETIADLRGLSQKELVHVPGVGKKSAALLYAAFKRPEQPQPVENNSSS